MASIALAGFFDCPAKPFYFFHNYVVYLIAFVHFSFPRHRMSVADQQQFYAATSCDTAPVIVSD